MSMDANEICAVKAEFFETQLRNLSTVKFSLPDFSDEGFSYWQKKGFGTMLWMPRPEITDESDRLMDYLGLKIPVNTPYAEARFYKIPINRNFHCRLASIFLYHGDGSPVRQEDADGVIEFIRNKVHVELDPKPLHWYITIGTFAGFRDECVPHARESVVFCERVRPYIWKFKISEHCRGLCTDEFYSHILPGVYRDEIEKIISMWRERDAENITVSSIRKRIGLARASTYDFGLPNYVVEKALDDLFFKGNYGMRKEYALVKSALKDGEKRVIPKTWKMSFAMSRNRPLRFSDQTILAKRARRFLQVGVVVLAVVTFLLSISPILMQFKKMDWTLPLGDIVAQSWNVLGNVSAFCYVGAFTSLIIAILKGFLSKQLLMTRQRLGMH